MIFRRRPAALLSVGVASAVLLGLAVAAPAPLADAFTGTTATYAVNEPLCSEPADPTAARCFGLKQQTVPKGTPGAYRVATTGGEPAETAAARAFTGFTPQQLAAAYRFNPKINRRNITVGIVLWHDAPNVRRDLNVFNRHYGLPRETARSFRKVNGNGEPSPLPQRDRGTAGEVALDTQAVRGVCRTCRILLVEAASPYGKDLTKAVNTAVRLGATIVTNSYGVPEHRMASSFIKAYRHPGVAMFASTGDAGWFGWDYANGDSGADQAPSFPATSPDVIAVGGTTLRLGAGNRRTGEAVWNNNGAHDSVGAKREQPMGASGGGCSKLFAAPAWQRRTPGYSAARCGGRRLAADLALVADPYTGYRVYDSYGSGGWVVIGGTSLSSPLAAGMMALAGGPNGSRFPATAVYGSQARRGARVDVLAGGTGFCAGEATRACATATKAGWGTNNPNKLGAGVLDCSFSRRGSEAIPSASRECNAAPGFDGPSGVGAPYSTRVFTRTDPFVKIKNSGGIKAEKREKFRAVIKTPLANTKITSLRWNWGDKLRTTTGKRSVSHTYRKAGRYTITLASYDSRGQTVIVKRTVRVR